MLEVNTTAKAIQHQSKPPQVLTAAELGPYWYKLVHSFPKPTEQVHIKFHYILYKPRTFSLQT